MLYHGNDARNTVDGSNSKNYVKLFFFYSAAIDYFDAYRRNELVTHRKNKADVYVNSLHPAGIRTHQR